MILSKPATIFNFRCKANFISRKRAAYDNGDELREGMPGGMHGGMHGFGGINPDILRDMMNGGGGFGGASFGGASFGGGGFGGGGFGGHSHGGNPFGGPGAGFSF